MGMQGENHRYRTNWRRRRRDGQDDPDERGCAGGVQEDYWGDRKGRVCQCGGIGKSNGSAGVHYRNGWQ